MTADPQDGGFGLYVHWPFCAAKCPYCDFNSHVSAAVDHAAWRRGLLAELRRQAAEHAGRRLDTIFFGGGTPSLMDPDTVGAVIAEAERLWPGGADREISLEANPTSAEAARFVGFRDAGVNRVSIGVQALQDDDLRRLGRTHDAPSARTAYDDARRVFDRVSLDLIYARQFQDVEAWAAELDEVIAMEPDHASLYQLTIEERTVFYRRARVGRLPGLPDENRAADLYEMTTDRMAASGRPAYEVSNHAVPGAECRHNLIYWRAGDWLGVGPGAHGRCGAGGSRVATVSTSDPAAWLASAGSASATASRDRGRGPSHAEEYLLTSLRLAEGLDRRRLLALGQTLYDEDIAPLVGDGLVHPCFDSTVRPTRKGMALADSLVSYLAARSSPARESISQS